MRGTIVFLLTVLILPLQMKAGSNENKFNLRIGINNNLILDRTDFKSGYSGSGLSAGYIYKNSFSVHVFISSFRIKAAESGQIKTNREALSGAEAALALRARLNNGPVRIFPQIGVGAWGWIAGNYFIGVGADVYIGSNTYFIMTADYLIVDSDMFITNNINSWTSSMYRISLCLTICLF